MKSWIASVLLLAAAAQAQAASLAAGTQEVRASGVLDPTTAGGDEIHLQLGYGYFFQDNVQAGGRLDLRDNEDLMTLGLMGYAEMNFDVGSVLMPFVEGALGVHRIDPEQGDTETALVLEGRAGAKLFLSEHVAVAMAGVFAYATEDIYPDKAEQNDTYAFIEVSLRCYL